MSMQYLEATYRPNINSFIGEYVKAVIPSVLGRELFDQPSYYFEITCY